MKKLVLYTTSGCHLCDKVENMLASMRIKREWYSVDIVEDDQLVKKFGTKIPVICFEGSDNLLCWPFNLEHLTNWIESKN